MRSVNHNGIPDKPRRARLYGRVSTEDQAERGTIDAQITFLRNFCQLYGIDVAGEYLDDGISGTVPLADRPEGRRLLDDSQADPGCEVIAYRLDRLGRTLKTLLDAHEQLEKCGVTIRSATEPFDTSTPIGTFLFQLLGSLAQLDRANILEKMSMGRDRVASKGRWTGGPIPLGYDIDAAGYLVPSLRTIEVLEMTEAEFARSIFQRIADRETTAQSECLRLNALKVPCVRRYARSPKAKVSPADEEKKESEGTTEGRKRRKAASIQRTEDGTVVVCGGEWFPSRLRQMIRNPLYKGVHVLAAKAGPIERAVPALVSEDLWQRANDQLTRNRSLLRRETTTFYLLRGLIQCGICGRTYVGTTLHRDGRSHGYYRCSGQFVASRPTDARCHNRALPTRWLEDEIWQDLRAFIADPGRHLADAQRQLRERLATSASVQDRRREIIGQLADKETERERVMTLFRRGKTDLDETERQLDAIAAETAELRRMLDAIRAQEALTQAFEGQVAEATALLARYREDLAAIERTNDLPRKREIAQRFVSRITAQPSGELVVRYIFAGPEERNCVVADTTPPLAARTSGGSRAW